VDKPSIVAGSIADWYTSSTDAHTRSPGIPSSPATWRSGSKLPERVSTDPAHITGDTASVTVRLHFGGSERHIIARVIRDPAADIWSIDDLACGH
jgi:hypothetical protein